MITAVAGAKKSAKSIFVRHGGVFVTPRAREWGMPGGAASVHQRAYGLCSRVLSACPADRHEIFSASDCSFQRTVAHSLQNAMMKWWGLCMEAPRPLFR